MNDQTKTIAVLVLVLAVFYFAFTTLQKQTFHFGKEITGNQFAAAFASAQKVNIFMDVQGLEADDVLRKNVIQCGVDFSGSSGMGGKNVSYFSVDSASCVSYAGNSSSKTGLNDCYAKVSSGLTIYVASGNSTKFYDNAMLVGIGKNYTLGSCGINRK